MPATKKRVVQKAKVPFRAKMKKVIRDEAKALSLIAGRLVGDGPVTVNYGAVACKGPGHCAMGALMFAAGISNKKIEEFEGGDGDYDHGFVARKLFDTYHIDHRDAADIISDNDSVGNQNWGTLENHERVVKNRMAKVFNTIEHLSVRERVRPPLTVVLD